MLLDDTLKELDGAAASFFTPDTRMAFLTEVLALGREAQAAFAQLAQENAAVKMEVGLLVGTVVYDVTQHATGALAWTVVPVKAITAVNFLRLPEQGHLRIVAPDVVSELTYTAATAAAIQKLAQFGAALRSRLVRGT